MNRIKQFFSLRTIGSKIVLAFIISGLFLLGATEYILIDTLRDLEEKMIEDKENTDMQYLGDYIDDGSWHVEDYALFKGDVLIGNGTEEAANITPFIELEEKTGTFFYTFIRADLADPAIKAEIDSRIPNQTNYLRVAGSTKNAKGESIVGTYMDKAVSDVLDVDGTYSGEANVEGRAIYCLYNTFCDDSGRVVGATVVGRSIAEINDLTMRTNSRIFVVVIAALAIAITVLAIMLARWLRALKKAGAYLDEIGTGFFPEEPLRLNTRDEMDEMADTINAMAVSLKEKERIGLELSLATDIQAHMLPSIFPAFPEYSEFDVYATMNPAKEVGGDFYDFYMLDEKTIAVTVSDVSGKGVPAALFMVIAKTLLKNHAQMGLSPAEIFTKVNQMLCEGNDAGLFVTSWLGIIDLETGVVRYVNAGHNPPLVKLGDGGFEYLHSRPGFVLAGMEGVRYRQSSFTMQPGDKILLYTDGVTEATTQSEELYGEERLQAYANAHKDDGVVELLHGLRSDINAFVGDAEQFDDITMLIFDFNKNKGASDLTEKEFIASDEKLNDVLGFVEEELDKVDCPPKYSMQIAVAVEELFVNIAHYAYVGAQGKMQLGFKCEEGVVTLRFVDRGMPFDPTAKVDPDITLSAEERSIGGLGIYMVKKTMDSIHYKYETGRNILTITKRIAN